MVGVGLTGEDKADLLVEEGYVVAAVALGDGEAVDLAEDGTVLKVLAHVVGELLALQALSAMPRTNG